MADNMMLFTIDASQIVVKLHYAGLQPIRGDANENHGFIVNTGIVDYNESNGPDNIGKTRFNLNNSSGMYYVGWVRDFSYTTLIDLDNVMTDLLKMQAEMAGEGKKLLSTTDDKDKETIKRFESLRDQVISTFKFANSSQIPANDDFNSVDGIKKIRAEAKKLQDEYVAPKYNEQLNKAKEEALPLLEKYMNVFAGEDNVNKITIKSIMAVQVSNSAKSPNDKVLVKDFEIQAISKKESDILNAEFKRKALTDWETGEDTGNQGEVECDVRMCFYVKYMLKVEEK